MAAYDIELAPGAQKDIRALSKQLRRRVITALDKLAERPRGQGAIKLKGYGDQYRVRVGDYRVIYEIDDKHQVVDVVAVRHRSESYR